MLIISCFFVIVGEKGDVITDPSQETEVPDNDCQSGCDRDEEAPSSDLEDDLPHKIPSAHVSSLLPQHRLKQEPEGQRFESSRQMSPQSHMSEDIDDNSNLKYNRMFSTPSPGLSPPPHPSGTPPPYVSNEAPLDLTCKSPRSALKSICSNSTTKKRADKSSTLTSLESRFGGGSSIIEKLSNNMSNSKNPLYNAFGGNLYTSALYNTAPLMTTDQLYRPERKYWPLSVTSPIRHGKSSNHDESQKNHNNNNTSKSTTTIPATQPASKKPKPEVSPRLLPVATKPAASLDKEDPLRYTNLTCSCQKQYESLYELTMHMQKTGHVANVVKFTEHTEYPKLVRGQDMWLNQGSEQTRQILRCMQCAESFKSLPELTIHMIKTKHYTNIVGGEAKKVHRCSSYCDKCDDTTKSVFRCKVCHDRFSDMEHLADHMMISGHYMKTSKSISVPDGGHDLYATSPHHTPVKTSSNHPPAAPNNHTPPPPHLNSYSRDIRDYTGEDSLHSADDDITGGSRTSSTDRDVDCIKCEYCEVKVAADAFVDHVQVCIQSRLSPVNIKPASDCDVSSSNGDVTIKEEIKSEVKQPERKSKNDILSTPKGRALQEYYKEQQSPRSPKSSSTISPPLMPSLQDKYLRPDSPLSVDVPASEGFMASLKNCIDKHTTSVKSKVSPYNMPFTKSFKQTEPVRSNTTSSLSPRAASYSSRHQPRRNTEVNHIEKLKAMNNKPLEKKNSQRLSGAVVDSKLKDRLSPLTQYGRSGPRESPPASMRVLSPTLPTTTNNNEPQSSNTSSNSALEAMQSFIDRSFYGNSMSPSANKKKTAKRPHKSPSITVPKQTHNYQIPDSTAPEAKQNGDKHHLDSRHKTKEKKETSPSSDAESNTDSMKSTLSDSHVSDGGNVFEKYLTNAPSSDAKANALESLHGLVYGESVESEHPLDSLQRLIHTTDDVPSQQRSGSNGTRSSHTSSVVTGAVLPSGHSLPSTVILVNPIVTVMSNKNKHDPPSLQINIPSKVCSSPSTTPIPRTSPAPPAPPVPSLSPAVLHSPASSRSRSTTPSSPAPSSSAGHRASPFVRSPLSSTSPAPPSPLSSHSPLAPSHMTSGENHSDGDGGAEELLCKSCRLSFISRGEYRLHQRYCPVLAASRNKDPLGISSPYIYLPLDHSIKFNKYYEMANELAEKNIKPTVD